VASVVAAMGGRVVLAGIADPTGTARKIRNAGGEALAIRTDVTDPDDCKRMVTRTVDAFGGLDGLVNNAALFTVLALTPLDEIEPAEWDKVMEVNVKGAWLATRAAIPAMVHSGGGSVVMIATNRIFRGYPELLHYDASKGAILAMTRSMIRELGPKNVRVNAVAPGLTISEGVLRREGIAERAARIAAHRSLARDQMPEDLTGPVAFFLSDHAAFVTGQSLVVDGGGIVH